MGVKGVRKNIKFGKIYGSNRLDYIWLKEEDDRWDMHVWENVGAGGTKVKGDGVFYCDMRGTGADDYVVSEPCRSILSQHMLGLTSRLPR